MGDMVFYSKAAVERAMKVQEVILREEGPARGWAGGGRQKTGCASQAAGTAPLAGDALKGVVSKLK